MEGWFQGKEQGENMKEICDVTKPLGGIIAIIEYKNKPTEILRFPNTVVDKGREALARFLATQDTKPVFIQSMLFGDGGMDQQEKKKTVTPDRNSLFGVTRLKKPVVAQIDPVVKSQAILTSVITFEEGNGYYLSEMALQLNNEDLFSMATFPSLGKTDQMQITWTWRLSFV